MARRTTLSALATVLVAPVLLVVTADASTSAPTMPTCPSTRLTKTGTQSTAVNQTNNGGTWNLTGAVWDKVAPSPIAYPVRSDAWTRGCLVGATVYGDVPKSATRDQWYNAEDGGTRQGGEAFRQTLTDTPGNFLLMRDTYAEDYEDAYDPNGVSAADTMYLDHVQAKYIRDDCIENEGSGNVERPMNLVINRSLFDGCFTGIAERPMYAGGSVQNGSGPQSLTIDNTLMYIQPQPLGPNYCSDAQVTTGRCKATSRSNVWMGAHGIWKWSRAAASKVTIRNSVFKLDMASYTSCGAQVWPAGTYQNVTLVWAGAGPYATAGGCKNTLPAGVTLTTDNSVWSKAKAAWLEGSTTPASRQTSTATPTRVSAGVVRHRVGGTLATLSGHRVAGASMTLQRRSVGSSRWVPVTRARTSSVGVARVTVRPARTSYFRWVFGGEAHHAASRSAAVRVRR